MKKYAWRYVLLALVMLSSCRSLSPLPMTVVHDTLIQVNLQRDSVYIHDSIYMNTYTQGDTVYVNHYRDRWRDKIQLQHDTTIVTQTATQTVVQYKIPPWCKWCLGITIVLIVLIVLIVAVWCLKKVPPFGRTFC